MDTQLSPEAVATLRSEIKGWRARDGSQRRAAYRELAGAGIMELAEGDYRITRWGLEHREEILGRESDRIEAGRMLPPDRELSEAARERLRLHLAGDRTVTEENHPACRELEAARVVHHTRPLVGGDSYRLAYWGLKMKGELLGEVLPCRLNGPSSPLPAPEVSLAPGG